MASISNLMNTGSASSTSSIYGNRNVLSGLASGMDTEALIQNCISGYQSKITQLQQQQTKITWKQDAYRNITDKLISLSTKYASYTSKTNLSSPGFFTNSVNTITNGTNKDKVSATGRASSELQINAVKQLATSARYSVASPALKTKESAAGAYVDLTQNIKQSKISGSLTLTVGRSTVSLDFDDDEVYETAGELASAINKKLSEQSIGNVKADSKIRAVNSNGTISFKTVGDAANSGDSIWISGASGNIKSQLGITAGALGKGDTTIDASDRSKLYSETASSDFLSFKNVEIKMGDKTAVVNLGNLSGKSPDEMVESIKKSMQDKADEVFGKDKLTVSYSKEDKNFTFTPAEKGTEISITSNAGSALGFGSSGLSNTLDSSAALSQIFSSSELEALIYKTADAKEVRAEYTLGEGDDKVKVTKGGDGEFYRLNEDGSQGEKVAPEDQSKVKTTYYNGINLEVEKIGDTYYELNEKGSRYKDNAAIVINGVKLSGFDRKSTVDDILAAINDSDAGVRASYSKLTGKFVFTSKETGANSKVEIGGSLGEALFGSTEIGKAEVNTAKGSILADQDGKEIVLGSGSDQYMIKTTPDGKYLKTDLRGMPIRDPQSKDPMNPKWIEITKEEIAGSKELQKAFEKATVGYTAGQDAVISATVNGDEQTFTFADNTIDMDGMSVTLSDTFNEDAMTQGSDGAYKLTGSVEKSSVVTFTTKTDSDKILEAMRDFVKDVNELLSETRSSYSTTPLTNSQKKRYEPLTDEEKADLTEKQIADYEEKAKTGILFGDTDLSRLYNSLTSVFNPSGPERGAFVDIGLGTTYENGVMQLTLNEDKFIAAMEKDAEAVSKVFTSKIENGDSYDGMIAKMKNTVESFASTSTGNFGILVNKAGTKNKSSSLLNNILQNQISRLDEQISSWQTKMSDKVDYYTRQFTQLEKLINEMNSQSSALSGMMGY